MAGLIGHSEDWASFSDRRRSGSADFHHTAKSQRGSKPYGDFGLHVGELLLDQLVRRQWTAELLTVQHILPRTMPAEFGSAPGAE